MSFGYRVYKRDTIPAGSAQSATFTELASGSGYDWARQARDAATRVIAELGYDTAGPDHATGYPFEVFEE